VHRRLPILQVTTLSSCLAIATRATSGTIAYPPVPVPRYVTLAIICQTILVFWTVWQSATALALPMVLNASVLLVTDGRLQSVSVSVLIATLSLLHAVLPYLCVSWDYWHLQDSYGGAAALLLFP
jgi:hypothetical protein